MVGEQTLDIVDTPAPDRRDWPSLDDFCYPEEISKWRNIPTVRYKILEYFDQGRNRFGPAVVLKLENESRSIVFVWAPTSVVFALQRSKEAKFIWNLGVKVSDNGNEFFDFKIC